MQRDRYPPDWEAISLAKRKAAGWKCEWCGVAQGAVRIGVKGKPYKIVLTVAHLGVPHPNGRPGDKHDKMDCRPENLAALCQACHLRYDIDEHVQHAKERRARRLHEAAMEAGQLALFESATLGTSREEPPSVHPRAQP